MKVHQDTAIFLAFLLMILYILTAYEGYTEMQKVQKKIDDDLKRVCKLTKSYGNLEGCRKFGGLK